MLRTYKMYLLILQILDDNTKVEYGFSYILGWVGMGVAGISGILYMCAAYRYCLLLFILI